MYPVYTQEHIQPENENCSYIKKKFGRQLD